MSTLRGQLIDALRDADLQGSAVIGFDTSEIDASYERMADAALELLGPKPAPDLSGTEAATVARFEAAEPAPESYVRQHQMEADCWCKPRSVGTLGVLTHNMGDDQ